MAAYGFGRRLYVRYGEVVRAAGHGRTCEFANGGFVEAKRETPLLALRQLRRSPYDGFGHRCDCRLPRFIAEKRSVKFRFLEAAGRHRVVGAQSGLMTFSNPWAAYLS
jgi:hypothetical protein